MNGDPQAVSRVDALDQKLIEAFPGRVVRKDLVYKLKVGFSIPVYVLEYLLGKHCSTTDEEQIGAGLAAVKQAIAERVVRADQSELIKSRLQRSGSMKLIDLVTVTFDEKDQGGKYWARLMTAGLEKVHIHVGQRDRRAAVRTISGLLKLIHPDGKCTREEMTEYIQFALEMRRRVKEQLKRINPSEFPKVNLSYIDKESGDEFFAECKEIGATRLIPEGPLSPGDVFSVGRDTVNDRVALFRIQVAALPGNGRFQVVGVSAKAVKESARMAFEYLRANAKRVGLDRDLGAYDFNIQVISPTHGKDTADLGVAFYIAILSAIVNKPIAASLVVMGQMSIHGILSRVEQLGDRLRVVMDAGARLVLIPTVNAADLGAIPPELLDKVRVDFYNDPAQAAFKAMEEA